MSNKRTFRLKICLRDYTIYGDNDNPEGCGSVPTPGGFDYMADYMVDEQYLLNESEEKWKIFIAPLIKRLKEES